jgi:zinc protease
MRDERILAEAPFRPSVPTVIPSMPDLNPSLAAIVVLAVALSSAPTLANPFEMQLANGLRVIVKEDNRAPTAVHMVWYRAGSMDEKDGTSGVAHALEHLMFKATKNLRSGEFNKRVAEAGGRDNAFTSRDYTAYFQIVPKAALPEMMKLEADRMANLKLDAKEFDAEIKVVMEERRLRTDDNPQALVHEALNSVMYQAHPYRRPIIGWMDDLENMTWQDARDWYRQWYAPNNAYVVVVGRRRSPRMFSAWRRKYYGPHKPQVLPLRKPQNEPEQAGVRRVSVKAPAKLPYLAMAWRDAEIARRAEGIGSPTRSMSWPGCSTDMTPRVSRRTWCAAAALRSRRGAGYDGTLRGEASFMLDGQPAEGKTVADLEAALRAEIKRIQDEGRVCRGTGPGQDPVDRGAGLQARFADGPGHGDRRDGGDRAFLARH